MLHYASFKVLLSVSEYTRSRSLFKFSPAGQ